MCFIELGVLIILVPLQLNFSPPQVEQSGKSPEKQFQALLKDYNRISSSGKVLTDEERLKFVGQVYKHRYDLARRFIDLAEKNPHNSIAVDSLCQAIRQVNNTPWPAELVGKDEVSARALALLLRDHVRSDKLGKVCLQISGGFNQEYETFLRGVLEKSPHQNVRALACLGLGHFLVSRLQRVDMVREEPKLATEFENLFGREYLKNLLRQDRQKVHMEAENFLEIAGKKYANVKIPEGGTVGDKARAELFEIRFLSIGQKAQEIEGLDQNGINFKLSDYRGKVVLLDFWHQQ